MPLTPVVVPRYPNVPAQPGVPPLDRVFQVLDRIILLVADATLILRAIRNRQLWGIFSSTGAPFLTAVGEIVVLDVEQRQEYRIADYPIEQGGFGSYNKVATPRELRVTIALSGKESLLTSILTGGVIGSILTGDAALANRTRILAGMEAAAATLSLFRVSMPEGYYPNMNITHWDFRRDQKGGATMLRIDVWLAEVRVIKTAKFSNTQAVSGADAQNGGPKSPEDPTVPQSSVLSARPGLA